MTTTQPKPRREARHWFLWNLILRIPAALSRRCSMQYFLVNMTFPH